MADAEHLCAECGLRAAAGEQSGPELRDLLFARDFEQPALFGRQHRLAVDCYCVQHSAHVRSAKSLAAHLCGLCVALERDDDREQLTRLQRWLSTNPRLEKPNLPAFRGDLTIRHVSGVQDPVAYAAAVGEWASSAWNAYGELQERARQWLDISARHKR